jgi:hypothetical protein
LTKKARLEREVLQIEKGPSLRAQRSNLADFAPTWWGLPRRLQAPHNDGVTLG